MHELAAQGMVPLSINEGAAKAAGHSFKPIHIIYVGMALMVIGFAFKVFVLDNKPSKLANKNGASSKAVTSTPSQRAKKETTTHISTSVTNIKNSATQGAQAQSNLLTNTTNNVSSDIATSSTNKPARRMFDSGTEQVISWIVNTKIGDMPPPLPNLPMKEDIASILNRDIVLYDDDSDEKVDKKANVAHAKQLLKEFLVQGGKPEEFLSFFREELKKAHNEWKEAQLQTMSLYKQGNHPEALKYAEEQNKKLVEKGIKPIVLPSALKEK
jgi:hypothetical protein